MTRASKTFSKRYIKEQIRILRGIDLDQLDNIIHLIKQTIEDGNTIYICGNGGSFCSSLHFAEDMVKCVGEARSGRVKCIALGSNPGQLTCLSNDFSYNDIFSYELESFIEAGDVIIGLSVSGTSRNVLNALSVADTHNADTILITGCNCPYESADFTLKLPTSHFGRAEDATMVILHLIINYLVENYENEE